MSKRARSLTVGAVALVALALGAACSSLQPPEDCAISVGGSADEAAFAQHFSQVAVVAQGEPLSSAQEDPVFSTTDTVEVVSVSLADTPTNLCLQERKGGGKVRYDETPTLRQGEDRATLGSFGKGDYVVRVHVGQVLVKNLTFTVR